MAFGNCRLKVVLTHPSWCCLSVQGEFRKSTIAQGHVGVGLQVATGDLNGDKRVDIAVAGKSGTFILFNMSR